MGAAARGVAAENGYILGIAPRFFDQPGVLYEKCTEFIFTENMRERKKLLEEKSDATIVAPGGIGTYEEFFEIFTLKSLKRIDRPIVLYNIDGYYDKMKALLEKRNAWIFPCWIWQSFWMSRQQFLTIWKIIKNRGCYSAGAVLRNI